MGRHHKHKEQQEQVHRGTEQPSVCVGGNARCSKCAAEAKEMGWTGTRAQIIKRFEYHDKKLRPFPASNGEPLKYFK